MKSFYLKQLFLGMIGVVMVSCYKTDKEEMIVYLGADITKEAFAEYVSDLDKAESLIKAHEEEVESFLRNPSNPDVSLSGLAPDEYILTAAGMVGVIDLGLSHKWACVNVGCGLPSEVKCVPASFKEFLGVAVKPDVSMLVDKTAVRYEDYLKVLNYIEGANKYAYDYKKYAPGYYYEVEARYDFLFEEPYDTYVVFGYPSLWQSGCQLTSSMTLSPEEDAATVLWGKEWATPSKEDLSELITRCYWRELYINNQKGALVTGPSNKRIWLPLVGTKGPNGEVSNEDYGFYICNTKKNPDYVWTIATNNKYLLSAPVPSNYGYCLRPVLR